MRGHAPFHSWADCDSDLLTVKLLFIEADNGRSLFNPILNSMFCNLQHEVQYDFKTIGLVRAINYLYYKNCHLKDHMMIMMMIMIINGKSVN